jgi:hypothetical protein
MTELPVLRVIVLSMIGIGFLPGCGIDTGNKLQPIAVVEGTDVDLLGFTTFSNPESAYGELVYIPIYSSAFHQAGDREHLLTATLSIHNIDILENIEVSAVSYFDTEGRPISEFLRGRIVLEPLSTRQFVVPEADRSGGTGANFLVKWESETEVTKPVIEALMLSTSSQQGISFITKGTVVRELRHAADTSIDDRTKKEGDSRERNKSEAVDMN